MITQQIELLKQEGKLDTDWGRKATSAHKPAVAGFIWPLKQADGFHYNSIYGVSNYVDHNLAFPNQVQDWNCGVRTYDQPSGYNHEGVDIYTWPFGQNMQEDEQAVVIAASEGVIIAKDDGFADHSCSLSGGSWNAVYVGNTDGTISWYGHLKKHSLTTKVPGQSVAQGEYLGIVGSSGNSSGPHLHFEVHDSDGNVIDPFAGPCNPGSSLWNSQKPYIEPTINVLMTHGAPPIFPACPQLEIKNSKDTFANGELLFAGSYLHDQDDGLISYQLTGPDGNVYHNWTHHLDAGLYYSSSYWYWIFTVNSSWLAGEWQFKATYAGETVAHNFYISNSTGVSAAGLAASTISVFPNPSAGTFQLSGLTGMGHTATVTIYNNLGQKVQQQELPVEAGPVRLQTELPSGHYRLRVQGQSGVSKNASLLLVR